ncbi:hypothetical protein VC83_09243 [Pseudogymnoascus destructans]|uniref:Mid2 domain-containing protein n=1 Tax=Pseudogymnoascus destructans TaxID=655981 RepID=A0A176ZWY2_9PEZI|nr:uncharacterized protein VC83_09243 [Pseudogymnoascus destructans]OAF54436.1 hypothetical protein VC83_09243 [Pseudogymnoascus destructans]
MVLMSDDFYISLAWWSLLVFSTISLLLRFYLVFEMMRRLVVFWVGVLLFDIQYAGVQAQKAVWKTPVKGENLEANTIDSVLLDWTSTLPTTILRMWCQNKTDANNLVLASSFFVDSKGPFEYVMEQYLQDKTEFPLACHAELAEKPVGGGTDCPAAIVWSSNAAEAAKTVSQTKAASTVTITPSANSTPPGQTPTPTPTPTPSSTPPSTTDSTTSDSPSKPPTPTSSTGPEETAKSPTNSSGENPSGATTAPVAPASTPNSTGAIIGGAIGGVALIAFIILAVLFLRKFQRNRAASPIPTESTRRSFYLFNAYNKRGPKARTTGVFEKEGEYGLGVQEKEGGDVSRSGGVYELPESQRERRYSPVELPGGSVYYP